MGWKSPENSLYRAYRKIRFVARRGTLFRVREEVYSPDNEIRPRAHRIILLNSLFFFLLAYLIIYLLHLLTTGIAALISDIPIVLYYDHVDFIIRSKDWTADAVNIVFSSGPLLLLILSVVFFIVFFSVEMETGILRLLLFWMLLHALSRCLGEIFVGTLMNKGFGFVILYMFIMDTGKLILTLSTMVLMLTIGLFLARPSLYTANIYFNDLPRLHRRRFVVNQFLVPFFAGNLLIMMVKLPEINLFDISVNASMILLLLPILTGFNSVEDLYFDEEPRRIKFYNLLPIITIAIFIIYRIVFGIGVRVGL